MPDAALAALLGQASYYTVLAISQTQESPDGYEMTDVYEIVFTLPDLGGYYTVRAELERFQPETFGIGVDVLSGQLRNVFATAV